MMIDRSSEPQVMGSNPTEPANYRGSYTTVSKEIVDIEITMYQSVGTIIIGTITVEPGTLVITAIELLLLKLTVIEEEGGLRN